MPPPPNRADIGFDLPPLKIKDGDATARMRFAASRAVAEIRWCLGDVTHANNLPCRNALEAGLGTANLEVGVEVYTRSCGTRCGLPWGRE